MKLKDIIFFSLVLLYSCGETTLPAEEKKYLEKKKNIIDKKETKYLNHIALRQFVKETGTLKIKAEYQNPFHLFSFNKVIARPLQGKLKNNF